jgi:TRAP-type mannitol/chloroaromatic compound transport system permease small subunit
VPSVGAPEQLSRARRARADPVSRHAYTRRMLRRACIAAAFLVLPLAALLFAQWPLRELVQAWSRQANDAAQVLFALAMAFGVGYAGRTGTHLVAGPRMRSRRVAAFATLACVLPWAVFMLWTLSAPVWESLRTLEKFPDTLNPGYFLIKAAAWILVLLALLQSVADAWRVDTPDA